MNNYLTAAWCEERSIKRAIAIITEPLVLEQQADQDLHSATAVLNRGFTARGVYLPDTLYGFNIEIVLLPLIDLLIPLTGRFPRGTCAHPSFGKLRSFCADFDNFLGVNLLKVHKGPSVVAVREGELQRDGEL